MSDDATLKNLRASIASLDQTVLQALNARLVIVRALKAVKEEMGLPFHDPAQEERLLAELGRTNPGPLSEEGLREIYGVILERIKREASVEMAP
jgi:chorismate mutase